MATRSSLIAELSAEFVGTFALVFFGLGAIVTNQVTAGAVGHVGVSLAFGLVIGVMVYAFKEVSGAQFNPAVTVALWMKGLNSAKQVAYYIATQLVAASAAALVVRLIAESLGVSELGATVPIDDRWALSLVTEVLTTFALVTVILGVVRAGTDNARPWAGLAIGGTVALAALAFGPISGASMNPARSFGPALFQPGSLRWLWLYAVGPVAGAGAAVAVERLSVGADHAAGKRIV